jgi:hypothetical protein
MFPRRGCVGAECFDNRFYIFGGVYQERLDFYEVASSIGVAEVNDDEFTISQLPKRKDRHLNRPNFIKPKLNYRVERSQRNSEEGASNINLTVGYGRSFMGEHSLQSNEQYNVSFEFEGVKIGQISAKDCRVVRLERPIEKGMIGRFYTGPQEEVEEKFSDRLKDWMVAEGRVESNGEREILTVLDDSLRVQDFKVDHKRRYLFGWDKTIR